jgi:HSP20 family protein
MADQKSGQQQPTRGNGGNQNRPAEQSGGQRDIQRSAPGGAELEQARRSGSSLLGMDPFSLLTMSPFALMRRFSEEMDQMLSSSRFAPQIDVAVRDNQLVVHADLPGVKPEDLRVELRNGLLCIEGERRFESESKTGDMYRSERNVGMFRRQIPLPDEIQEDQIKAQFDNGVLEIVAPLTRQRGGGRRIEVQSGSGRKASE